MNNKFSKVMVSVLIATMGMTSFQGLAVAQTAQQQQKLTQQQISALVAPIALYPDSLMSQILMASTYPVQVAEAYQWYQSNKNLKGTALTSALKAQQWDQSVKSIVHFPQVIVMMGSKLSWTQDLGNAVLAQQSDVLAAIQALRAKAKAQGNLSSNSQQTVTTQDSGSTQVIVIQPTNPQVVYVPTYNPTVVYGGWPYPAYPPVAYYPPGYVAGTALLSFGVGMAVGAALWGGCHWGGGGWGGGGNSLTINNNNFNNFSRQNVDNYRGGNFSGSGSWSHNGGAGGFNGGNFNGRNVDQERSNLQQNMSRDGFGSNDRGYGGSLNDAERNQANRDANQMRDESRFNQNHDVGSQGRQAESNFDRNEMNRQANRDGIGGERTEGDRSFGGGGERSFGGGGERSFGGGGHFGGGGGFRR